MIDLHCHLLPGIDDGAADLAVSLEMARAMVADGVAVAACTPHILPGLYHNTGPDIRAATMRLQTQLKQHDIPLHLTWGADNHVVPDFVAQLREGHLLPLAGSRYVLVEPPHHVAPPRMEEFFFNLLAAGYVPILTHPERLTWINGQYDTIKRLARSGVWMQLTAGSLSGAFGHNAKYWAERMLGDGLVHILATDAHDVKKRPPNLSEGFSLAAKLLGEEEARHLVRSRPAGVLVNEPPSSLPPVPGIDSKNGSSADDEPRESGRAGLGRPAHGRRIAVRLRRLFEPQH